MLFRVLEGRGHFLFSDANLLSWNWAEVKYRFGSPDEADNKIYLVATVKL